jgi:protein-tyrosine phosphatase
VRGRAWRDLPAGPTPDFGVYLLGRAPQLPAWESRWVRWRDFGLPADPDLLRAALTEAWHRAADAHVEVACRGGLGRTGTSLACLAVLDGLPPEDAVAYVRAGYSAHAVETRAQAAFVARFSRG